MNKTNLLLAILLLASETPVECYTDLVERLPRKAIYVARWASWCAPCVEEFAYYAELGPILEENSIEILFLNL